MSKANLKGNVESITEFEYETVDLFGKIKRKITIPDSCVSGSQVTYDKVGNRLLFTTYYPDGTPESNSKYYYSQGKLAVKFSYTPRKGRNCLIKIWFIHTNMIIMVF